MDIYIHVERARPRPVENTFHSTLVQGDRADVSELSVEHLNTVSVFPCHLGAVHARSCADKLVTPQRCEHGDEPVNYKNKKRYYLNSDNSTIYCSHVHDSVCRRNSARSARCESPDVITLDWCHPPPPPPRMHLMSKSGVDHRAQMICGTANRHHHHRRRLRRRGSTTMYTIVPRPENITRRIHIFTQC